MNTATLDILLAKQNGSNPFIAEMRNDIVWVSDKQGTFEFETGITDDNWFPIEFHHEGKAYVGYLNTYEASGQIKVIVHTTKQNGQGIIVTDGEKFIAVEVTQ